MNIYIYWYKNLIYQLIHSPSHYYYLIVSLQVGLQRKYHAPWNIFHYLPICTQRGHFWEILQWLSAFLPRYSTLVCAVNQLGVGLEIRCQTHSMLFSMFTIRAFYLPQFRILTKHLNTANFVITSRVLSSNIRNRGVPRGGVRGR